MDAIGVVECKIAVLENKEQKNRLAGMLGQLEQVGLLPNSFFT